MSNCAVCHEPVVSGLVVHNECVELLHKTQQLDDKPLTIEELREMDGQPVYLAVDHKWYIVSLNYITIYGALLPCGVDMWGQGTSLSLLAECGLYRRKPSEWISVKDRLPDCYIDVLVSRSIGMSVEYVDDDGVWREDHIHSHKHPVTHWMPLPESLEVRT